MLEATNGLHRIALVIRNGDFKKNRYVRFMQNTFRFSLSVMSYVSVLLIDKIDLLMYLCSE